MPEPIVYPLAPPNNLSCSNLLVRPDPDGTALSVTPARASWRYLSFRAVALADGEPVDAGTHGQEAVVVTIAGGGVHVDPGAAHRPIDIPGRSSPFEALPWAVYLPAGPPATVVGRPDGSGPDGHVIVAIAEAPPSGSHVAANAPFVIGPDDVEIELRGAGSATRQINKIVRPESPADRLEVVEVLTPSGNWSSWPPHKHDRDDMPNEAVLEEIYYYRFRRRRAWGLQRVYRADRSRDCTFEVRDGDCVLVTDGYHPFAAAHGDDAYYLNALAGDRRTMAASFDPDLDWVRESWSGMAPDPRVPLVGR
ncbi:MAG: 5-deoxy-glucuronate isomerase [Chloroflexota bacterium]